MNTARAETCRKKEQGYVLVVVIFILLLLTVTVVALNRRAGLQAKIAANQVRIVQTQFGQLAAFEHAAWQLRSDPDLRTDTAGDSYEFDDVVYNRKIFDSTQGCPPNVIMVSITAPGGRPPVTAGLRIRYAYQDTVYIADTENNKIKKVGHTGLVYTVPTPELDKPHGVAVDASGNIYIADTHNDRIIMVDTSDAAEVLATGFIDEPHGLFVHNGSNPKLYIADQKNNRIKVVIFQDSFHFPRILKAGFLRKPRGVAVDCPGNVYIADTDNHRIKQVDHTGDVSVFSSGALDRPWDVAADDRGNIYVADEENHRVIKVNTGGAVTAIGGALLKPHGVAVGASGNIYIADTDNHCVRKVDAAGVVSVIAGACGKSGDNNSVNNPKLYKPRTVAVLSQATSIVTGVQWLAEFY